MHIRLFVPPIKCVYVVCMILVVNGIILTNIK